MRQQPEARKSCFIARARAQTVGEYTTEGFVVLKGSHGCIENVVGIQGTSHERFRAKLVEEGILVAQDSRYVFTRDHLFSSPSMAAVAVMSRTANGWMEWKSPQGKTLDEVKPQSVKVTD